MAVFAEKAGFAQSIVPSSGRLKLCAEPAPKQLGQNGNFPKISKLPLHLGPASSFAELCQAFNLIHDRYVASGYMKPHPSSMRYSFFHLLPSSLVFIAAQGKQVIGTATVVKNSSAGLPSKLLFPQQFRDFENTGRSLAEGCKFACDASTSPDGKLVSMQLLKAIFGWCTTNAIDDLCLVVNPKHVEFYERLLGFEHRGSSKKCPNVSGAEGILLHLDVKAVLSQTVCLAPLTRKLSKMQFEPESSRDSYRLTPANVGFLLKKHPEILEHASPQQLDTLEAVYTNLDCCR